MGEFLHSRLITGKPRKMKRTQKWIQNEYQQIVEPPYQKLFGFASFATSDVFWRCWRHFEEKINATAGFSKKKSSIKDHSNFIAKNKTYFVTRVIKPKHVLKNRLQGLYLTNKMLFTVWIYI